MKLLLYLLSIAYVLFSTSCQKQFLDTSPSSAEDINQSFNSYKDFEVALNGCYSGLQSKKLYGRNIPVIGEVLANNVKPSPNNLSRFINLYNYTHSASNQYVKEIWSQSYSVVNSCNIIIDKLDSSDFLTEAERNSIKSQALGIRSLCFLNLFQLYSPAYDTKNVGELSIPIPTKPIINSEIKNHSQATSKEVLDLIINDFISASEIATDADSPFFLNKLSIQALLSRACLVAKDYQKATYYAFSVIQSNQYNLVPNESYIESWEQEYSTESIFSIKFSSNDYAGTESFSYLYSKNGYGDFIATEDLLSKISVRDIRSQLYIDNYCEKYPESKTITGLNNFPVIRLSELYLNLAEAILKQIEGGSTVFNESDVIEGLLDPIKKRANPSTSTTEKSGSYLLDEVYDEFQRELAFEGHRFFNLKRRKLVIKREDCLSNNCSIDIWGGEKYLVTLPFPQSEINANPKLKQNENF